MLQAYTEHSLITININHNTFEAEQVWRRDWRNYSKDSICSRLAILDWNFESDSVQAYWNELENQLIALIDLVDKEICHAVTGYVGVRSSYRY